MPETEAQKLRQHLSRRLSKAIGEFRLIEENDRVMVGLSGGKDSLCLLELLAERRKIYRPRFELEAVHVRMENIRYESSTEYLQLFCDNHDVRLHLLTTRFDASTDRRKSPCFLCSWNRRKQIFNLAQQEQCNKLALGHHQDDLIHTAMMNLFFQGQFSTMSAKLKLRKMPLTIIRPLCMIAEKDLERHAELSHYEKQKKRCPHEKESCRTDMRQLFGQVEQQNAEARFSVWRALVSSGKLVEEE